MFQFKVYTIRDFNGCVRYVGKSVDTANRIWTRHKNGNSAVGIWICEQIALGNSVELRIEVSFNDSICERPDIAARRAEQHAVKYYESRGADLFNVKLKQASQRSLTSEVG